MAFQKDDVAGIDQINGHKGKKKEKFLSIPWC